MAGASTAVLLVQAHESSPSSPGMEPRRRFSSLALGGAARAGRSKSILREEADLRGQLPGGGRVADARPSVQPLEAPTDSPPLQRDQQQATPRWMVHPLDRKRRAWDWAILLLVLYSLVMVPWTVAFSVHEACDSDAAVHQGCVPDAVKYLDLAVDICFWLDVAVNFRTGYLDDRREVHMQPGRVAARYLATWCLVDLASVFPFKSIAALVIRRSSDMTLQLFLLPKLLRICRMFKKLNTWAAADLFRIVKLTILFLLMGHWVGCMWFYLGRWQIAHGSLNAFTGRMTWLQAFPGGGRAYLDADVRTKYTASLYWAVTTMTTVGYGDIVPLTNVERSFTCCVQLIGAVGTALVFGNVALLMQTSDGTAARYRQRLAAVQQFCTRHAVPPRLAARIKASVDYLWAAHAGLDAPAILGELSLPLQSEVLGHVQQHVVHGASLFKHCDSNLVNAVVVRLRLQVILPGDDVYTAGDSGSELFFIARGSVHVTHGAVSASSVIATLHEGEFFGEVEAFGVTTRRCVTVTAAAYCDLHVISKADLDDILFDFPEYRTTLQAAADQRLAELTARGAAVTGLWSPGDLTTPSSPGIKPPLALCDDDATDGGTVTGLAQAERMLDAVIAAQAAQEQALHAKLWALEEAHAAMAAKLEALTARHAEVAEAAARVQGSVTSGRLRGLVRSATARMVQTTRRIRPVSLESVSGTSADEHYGSA